MAGRVTERTIRNWLRRPAFRDAQRTARIRMLRDVTTSLHINAPGAVQTMVAIRDDPEGRATDRLAASRALIESMLRAAEKADLSERLEELESILAALEAKQNA